MKLALLGDIAFLNENILGGGWESRLAEVSDVLSRYDCVIANLETPLTSGKRTFVCKGMHLKSDTRAIPILKALHVTAVSLANNHAYDFGGDGLRETIRALDDADIAFFGVDGKVFQAGSGDDRITAHGFCCYSTNGAGYARVTGQKGITALTRENVTMALEADRMSNRFSILSLHWGDEYSNWPNARQVALLEDLAMKYDFLVHGHHAHVVQGVQRIGGSLAAYNLGNFHFDECVSPVVKGLVIRQSEANRQSFILEAEIRNGRVASFRTIGLYNSDRAMERKDISPFLDEIGGQISFCTESAYRKRAQEEILAEKRSNLNPRNLLWLMRKMNYYSIGAKIASYSNKRKYERAF